MDNSDLPASKYTSDVIDNWALTWQLELAITSGRFAGFVGDRGGLPFFNKNWSPFDKTQKHKVF